MTTYRSFSEEFNKSAIPTCIAAIRGQIAEACQSVGRDPQEVRLIAVSKTVGLPEVEAAIAAGVSDFGENRSSLFVQKQAAFAHVNWHFIGRIQTNKLKDIVGRAALIHSVASQRALLAINKQAEHLGVVQNILIEVNVSGEQSKDGVSCEELMLFLEQAQALPNVAVRGLMTMAPQGDTSAARQTFAGLSGLREQLQGKFAQTDNIRLTELSMGMSEDFQIAVQNGATMVRIGRSVWGSIG